MAVHAKKDQLILDDLDELNVCFSSKDRHKPSLIVGAAGDDWDVERRIDFEDLLNEEIGFYRRGGPKSDGTFDPEILVLLMALKRSVKKVIDKVLDAGVEDER